VIVTGLRSAADAAGDAFPTALAAGALGDVVAALQAPMETTASMTIANIPNLRSGLPLMSCAPRLSLCMFVVSIDRDRLS
jgi:hypothetical protein